MNGAAGEAVNGQPPQPRRLTPDDIVFWLRLVLRPGDVIELRILKVVDNAKYPPFTISGYFDYEHLERLARCALGWTAKAEGCYFTINPVRPDLLARAANRLVKKPERTTSDGEILQRTGLVFDADAIRPAGISATDEEKALAWERINELLHDLTGRGWPTPILADSGNGWHLWYKIDLPVEDCGLVQRVLQAAGAIYTDGRVKIDPALFNPARIIKLYGSAARKGDHIAARPHRWSGLISAPDELQVVPTELLEAFAAEYQPPPPPPKPSARPSRSSDHAKAVRDDGGLLPGEDFEQRATWEEILEPHGWTKDRTVGEEIHWTRPGKDGGTSATTGHNAGLHVFTSSAPPFGANENYSKFAVYALLEHTGDFSAAAKALSEQGYGARPTRSHPSVNGQDEPANPRQLPKLRPGRWLMCADRPGQEPNRGRVVKDLGDRAEMVFLLGEPGETRTVIHKKDLLNRDGSPLTEKEQKKDKGKQAQKKDEEEEETQSEILIRLAGDADFFHDPGQRAYALVPVEEKKETITVMVEGHIEEHEIPGVPEHIELHGVNSGGFRMWLKRLFYLEQEKPPGAQALQDALGILEARAVIDGPEEPVFLRVAGVGDRIYLDLCDSAWRVVEITAGSWRILELSPARFRRPSGLRPLPSPERGGSINDLKNYINCEPGEFVLIVASLAAALRPMGPYPLPILIGEPGTAKTTVARVLRRLIDPHKMPLRGQPKDERDLMVAAHNNWVVGLDNLSVLWDWASDGLCRLATGGGFGSRTLYTDDDETVLDAMRPVILTGIGDFVRREDLIDRGIFLHLPRIPAEKRRTESRFWAEFDEAHPKLLGALLDVVAGGLRELPSVPETNLPRMADFARFGEAVSRALGKPPGDFLKTYGENRQGAAETALEDSPVASAIRRLIETGSLRWEGTPRDLLDELTEIVGEKVAGSKRWPQSPRGMSGAVRRLAPLLRQSGINVDCGRGHERQITIEQAPVRKPGDQPTQPTQPTQDAVQPTQGLDGQTDVISAPCVGPCVGPASVATRTDAPTQIDAATDAAEVVDTGTVTANGDGCVGCDGPAPPLSDRRVQEVF
jgi:hypothetical protein